MPSSWSVYYVIFLSAFLALGIPVFLAGASYLVSFAKGRRTPAPPQKPAFKPEPNRTALGRRINARFFLGVNVSLILMALLLALIPCIGALKGGEGSAHLMHALVAVVSLAAFAGLGLLYSAKKGDLSWLKTYQDRPEEGRK